jgi:hypothetical protein
MTLKGRYHKQRGLLAQVAPGSPSSKLLQECPDLGIGTPKIVIKRFFADKLMRILQSKFGIAPLSY